MQKEENNPFLDSKMKEINSSPLHRFLGIEMKQYGRGIATAVMKVPVHLFDDGVVTEGPLTTLGSIVSEMAVLSLIGQGRVVITLEQQLSVLALAQAKQLIAKARVDHSRARLSRSLFEIRDDKGELVARGNVLSYTLPREKKDLTKKKTSPEIEEDPFHVETVIEDDSVF